MSGAGSHFFSAALTPPFRSRLSGGGGNCFRLCQPGMGRLRMTRKRPALRVPFDGKESCGRCWGLEGGTTAIPNDDGKGWLLAGEVACRRETESSGAVGGTTGRSGSKVDEDRRPRTGGGGSGFGIVREK